MHLAKDMIVHGSLWPEAVRLLSVAEYGPLIQVDALGVQSQQLYASVILTPEHAAAIQVEPAALPPPSPIRPGVVLSGPVLPEPIHVLMVMPIGNCLKISGKGLRSGLLRDPVLDPAQIAQLTIFSDSDRFDGSPQLFRLGAMAHYLGLSYEYDPHFALSVAKVDPLPHQLEAVYSYFLKLPRIRFLLADDPGAGKTIMAGLLLKELKARGLVRRTLIVTPANLTFQWRRELLDKFRETFSVISGNDLRGSYGKNPFLDHDQVITSISWISRIDDARDSLLASRWDLIIVDEAHKMAAYGDDKKTLAYRIGEALSQRTDHYLLMTATPHKGDPDNFCRFLALLDRDVYGSVQSLKEAMRRSEAPFYLRRTKESMVSFPKPPDGEIHKLFVKREVRTAAFDLDGDELHFYDQLTRYVEDQSILAASEDSARGRAVGFTMAMLQRRMASTVYAVRQSLQRMRNRRQDILADPERYRREQMDRRVPDDFDELPDDEQQEIVSQLEGIAASSDPAALRNEVAELSRLIDQARSLEHREIESKLSKLRAILTEQGVFNDPKMRLLIFTEHKDSLDFLVGDGKEGRPLGKLRQWGLTVTQIHGGMKIGDRDTAATRLYAEREFRDSAQVLVATEAAGEGINLQFCWLMVNYDIPWSPVRLEQRIGRIHRYGQEHECLVFNFVAQNTREGRVLQKLHERLREIRKELGTDQVFDVVGEVFPAAQLERLLRDMYARRTDEQTIKDRIVREMDPQRFRAITHSALEGLARKNLNLAAIISDADRSQARRLTPDAIERFFAEAAPLAGLTLRQVSHPGKGSAYRVGKLPRGLVAIGERQEPRFGKMGREYAKLTFTKEMLQKDGTLEWLTPGHPLFEAVREDLALRGEAAMRSGACFKEVGRAASGILDFFLASIRDGQGQTLHRRLFVVDIDPAGSMTVGDPAILTDLQSAQSTVVPPAGASLPSPLMAEHVLYERALRPWLEEVSEGRRRELDRVQSHVEISLNALIDRAQNQLGDYLNRQIEGQVVQGLDGLLAKAEQHLDELTHRQDSRMKELALSRQCTISDITHLGRALVVP